MLFILAVILIAISGILFMLFFEEEPKKASHQKIDNRAVPLDQHTIQTDEIAIVFDEPSEIRHINIAFDSIMKEDKISEDIADEIETTSSDNNQALTTNSKINPFNF